MNKIKMPAKLLKKWLKALRSGEYKQTTGTLYNPKTCGFCCLGVLQHVASGGKCEVNSDGDFDAGPSGSWYLGNGISMSGEMEQILMEMNDGKWDWPNGHYGKKKFPAIADFIEKNTETF